MPKRVHGKIYCSYTMMAKPMKTIKLDHLMIIFLMNKCEIGHVIFLRLDWKELHLLNKAIIGEKMYH